MRNLGINSDLERVQGEKKKSLEQHEEEILIGTSYSSV